MKVIYLTKGQETFIDDIDADLTQYKWSAQLVPTYKGIKYRAVRHSGFHKIVYLHRAIMERILKRPLLTTEIVDHIDRNPLNNLRNNLRLTDKQGNQYNRSKNSNNTSGYKGVFRNKRANKFIAALRYKNKSIHLGYFTDAAEAARMYDRAAIYYHKEFANLNFPSERQLREQELKTYKYKWM